MFTVLQVSALQVWDVSQIASASAPLGDFKVQVHTVPFALQGAIEAAPPFVHRTSCT